MVIPTYNDAGRIGDALASIAAQTLAPLEIVVSDDASTDGTQAVVESFAAKQPVPIRYLRGDTRRGVVGTRNDGIRAARGDWIANCDSDDTWVPTKLERQATFIRDWRGETPIALLSTYGYNTNDAGHVVSIAAMGATTEAEYLALQREGTLFFAIHSSVLFARGDFLAVGGYTDNYGAADELSSQQARRSGRCYQCRRATHLLP